MRSKKQSITIIQNLTRGSIWIGQLNYITSTLEKFGMGDSKPTNIPADTNSKLTKITDGEETVDGESYREVIGSLLYLSIRTRPDISFAVGRAARFCSSPAELTGQQ